MIEQLDPVTRDRSIPVTPQLAMRVAMLGVVAFILFAIVFFRLWYLQILTGDQYRVAATGNRTREVALAAPRGTILDRNGHVLVTSRQATVLQISPNRLPDAERQAAARWGQLAGARELKPKGHRGLPIPYPQPATPQLSAEFTRLGKVIGMSPRAIQQTIVNQLVVLPYAAITVKVGIFSGQRNYLLERQEEFPSIDPPSLAPVRDYPHGDLAAQLIGTVGPITKEEQQQPSNKGAANNAVIGQTGVEAEYNHQLRGLTGVQRYTVDAAGNPKGGAAVSRAPQQGDQVQLTIDRGLQTAGQNALAQGAADAASFGNVASGGAFVALDPRNGQVLGMGSAPTYDPSVFVKGMTFGEYQRLFGADSGSPQLNRAISSVYPTGSTFKPITALAALSSGKLTPNELIDDPGCIRISNQDFCDAGSKVGQENAIGGVDLVSALRVSSDVYFYRVGQRLNGLAHQPLQRTARMLGLDKLTGIDLPGEQPGTVPDRAWRREKAAEERAYEHKHHNVCPPNCVISDKRRWSVGDEVQLAVGQGDLQASPLQMAVAYSALANGGYVVHPHVLRAIQNSEGVFERQGTAQPPTKIAMNLTYRNLILEGLHEAASQPGGTSAGVFAGWNQNRFPIYGKTGTAQRGAAQNDQSWYIAYAYDSTGRHKRPIVIAMTIEKGGFGAQAAAPAVCQMLNHWFGQAAPCTPQDSRTR